MTETYTSKNSTHGIIKELHKDSIRLNMEDELFYNYLKNKMDTLLRQPQPRSLRKITSYSKAWRMPLI